MELFFLPPDLRGRGVGTEVMRNGEEEARWCGRHGAWLDTFGFQARGFYERLGYTVFGQLEGYPGGFARYFMQKDAVSARGRPTRPSGTRRGRAG